MKTLILYLSATGKTEKLAKKIANKLEDSDLLPITLKTQIPTNHFWLNFKFGFLMTTNWGFRYSIPPVDMDDYDQVIIGTPVWIGRAAPPLISVINKLRIGNKVKGAFATCGQGVGNVFEDLSERMNIKSLDHRLSLSESESYDYIAVQDKIEDFVNALKPITTSFDQAVVYEG